MMRDSEIIGTAAFSTRDISMTTVSADLLRTHLDYSAWASARLTEAAAALTEEELTRDFSTADKSVLGTLVHVFAADRIWLARVRGEGPRALLDRERDMHLRVLKEDWPRLLDEWKSFLATHTDETVGHSMTYRDMQGKTFGIPLWQIVLHMVNHGTHHRGQVSGFLRSMGHAPPKLDLMAYYFSQAQAASVANQAR
jgi:uncharacterized damage-inducible protein DinB